MLVVGGLQPMMTDGDAIEAGLNDWEVDRD